MKASFVKPAVFAQFRRDCTRFCCKMTVLLVLSVYFSVALTISLCLVCQDTGHDTIFSWMCLIKRPPKYSMDATFVDEAFRGFESSQFTAHRLDRCIRFPVHDHCRARSPQCLSKRISICGNTFDQAGIDTVYNTET